MNQYYYSTAQLYQYIENLNRKVTSLEKNLTTLTKEVHELRAKPSINVERIEYNFDQLKVETLDGTLNIGLSPGGLEEIEDFAVNQANKAAKNSRVPPESYKEVLDGLHSYVDNEVPTIISDNETQLERSLDNSYYQVIQEDIRKQLPERLNFYLQTIPLKENASETELNDWKTTILAKMKKDIQNAIFTFISNIPNHLKGSIPNEPASD
ncbi:spore germination protein GerPC [Bacillus seohaeanensis]|uniref:Spore germination protein GerPC n=1 Tax=Bacillus seohaeanensis TaxID=284580 RepID=A0ABW5RRX5_9BACI